jgi:membrane protease YdiL (CAAX protease family)
LYFTYYRHIRADENQNDTNIWHINAFDAAKVILLTVGARIAILAVHFIYIIILVELVKYNIKPQDIVSYYSESQHALKLVLVIMIIVVAPVVEEYVFRYYLYGKVFGPRMPLIIAAIFSAAIFTVLHFNVSVVPTLFGLGLFCAYLYQKKGYWAAVIAHTATNLITLLFI